MNEYYYERSYSVRRDRLTWGVQRLIFACVIVFVAQLLLSVVLYLPDLLWQIPVGTWVFPLGGLVPGWLGFQPLTFIHGLIWQPFTYMFLHAGLLHLFTNMLWLFFFGPEVERTLGTQQFMRFFVLCGAVGVLATFLTRGVLVVGASGAVMGVMVAFAMTNPEREFFLFPLPFPINARALVIIVIALNVISAMTPGSGRSVLTHFGGMLTGYGYMKLVPRIRHWVLVRERERRERRISDTMDDIGKAVDNILRFEDEKRKRH